MLCCPRCYERLQPGKSHRAKGGPYKHALPGSKGGGASLDMAELIAGNAGKARIRVVRLLASHGPKGAEDLAKLSGMDPDYISPRLSELTTQYGLTRKGPRTAMTRRGNPAHVYELTNAGRVAAGHGQQGEAA